MCVAQSKALERAFLECVPTLWGNRPASFAARGARTSVLLRPSAVRPGFCEYLRARCAGVSGYKLGDDRCNLVAALCRGFDGVGVVLPVATDEPRIDQRQIAG